MKPIGTFISLAILSIGVYLAYQFNKIKQYVATYGGSKVISLTGSRIIADIFINIKNPSDVNITVNGYELELFVNGSFVGNIKSDKPQVVKANDTTTFAVNIDFNPRQVIGQSLNITFINNLIKNKANLIIGLKGDAKLFGLFNIPIDIEEPLK